MTTQLAFSRDCRTTETDRENRLIARALRILDRRLVARGVMLTSPNEVVEYLKLRLGSRTEEVFGALFLDTKHRVLAFEELFYGSIDSAHVYPRVLVRRALVHNAGAVILTHNHPSGCAEPSQADRVLTARLREALELVDVRVLDHFIVGAGRPVSMAEYGWL